jgi:hypothetical protein
MKALPASPLPIDGNPSQCVELVIYDNDGPEGFFERMRFERSSQAIMMIINHFDAAEISELNFTITNHWQK